ncbi:MAG: hypothetical protein CMF74_10445 [Maricaulis sp.]|nr:hypothetical protein [Maricaulis sp.]
MAEIQTDDKQVELELDTNEDTEVEVKEDEKTSKKTTKIQSKTKKDTEEKPEVEVEKPQKKDEHDQYTDSVQNRINKLTKKMREAERQREEAIRYAQQVQDESTQIKQRLKSLDQGYMTEYGGRLEVEQKQVEADLKRAVELGDADATVSAQQRLTQLAVAKDRYDQAKIAQQQREEQEKQQEEQQPVYQQPQTQQQQAPKKADPKAEDWASRNKWFGQDEAMTYAAFGIHKRLIEDEGFDGKSDEYYNELDRRLRDRFPREFDGDVESETPPKKVTQSVAGVSRSSTAPTSSGRNRKVRLTPSQVQIAKKLGVPLEEYAKYVRN